MRIRNFSVHHHAGYDLPVSDLGNSSAGCLLGRIRSAHKAFMNLVKDDARFIASSAHRFTTAVLDGSKLT